MPMNHGVTIRTHNHKFVEGRHSLLSLGSERIEVVDMREAFANFAVDGLETKSTARNLTPDSAVVGLLRSLE
jgi:hypothetical protein